VSPDTPGVPAARKRCTVAYATRERQYLWDVELPTGACIADALAAARAAAGGTGEPAAGIPWDAAAVGIFGEPRTRSDRFEDGDRIELYRPLHRDPRERRRERVQRERRTKPARGS
jgi:putative ubiquitin-RnfH superfamily antitoxin RatB of RatAB toxin-antitoxin module